MPKLITFKEMEEIFGLKKNTMTKLYMRGEFIPAVKIGNRNYFKVEELQAWIEKQKDNAKDTL
ncbi:MAG: helix-turn-helix domain-containing protein [Sulfurovum sp.]|nr:helix-turn-helix domain-containing protein [Sulfurovum sp.]